METTQILITAPTLNEVFGWLVFYLFIGNVVSLIGCFGLVMSDYGRTVCNGTAFSSPANNGYLLVVVATGLA